MMRWLAVLVDVFEQALTDAVDDLTGDEASAQQRVDG